MPQTDNAAARPHRTIFLSDLHLGSLGGRADLVLEFLQGNRADCYYLVGDVLDLWHPALAQWGRTHQAVIEHLHARQAAGARLVYIRGNHDPRPDQAGPSQRLPVPAQDHAIHDTADGRRFLVLHGDEVDTRVFRFHIMTRIGSRLEHLFRRVDQDLAWLLGRAAAHRRSVIEGLLSGISAMYALRKGHERTLVAMARDRGLDGVICGHFHLAALHDRHGLTYANCGDWVDSFTALAEDHDGRLVVLGGRAALAQSRPAPIRVAEGLQA